MSVLYTGACIFVVMHKGKASASVEVKQVILALCKLLTATALDSVPAPETFRRAKFGGGPDVEEQLWELLASILQRTCPVSLEIGKHPNKDLRKLVAAGLWQTGFYADWMYREPRAGEEGDGGFSSRDLLLALGWLIANGALEKLLSQRVEELDKTLLTSTPVNLERSFQVSSDLQLDGNSLRRLQWLLGSLRHQGRILLSMQEERARLLHKVLNLDLSSDVPAVSSGESSALIKKDCARLQELCGLLEAYLKWKQAESVFWTWMDSVVDGHLTDLESRKPTPAPERSFVCLHGNQGLEKFEEVLQGSQKWLSKNRPSSEEHCAEGAEGGFDASLETLLCPEPSLPRVLRAELQKPGTKPSSGASQNLSAARVSQLLRQREAELLKERERLRRSNRERLEKMMESLEGLMLIPP